MTRITGGIVIDAPADVVFGFVAGQRNESAYNPHMVRSATVTPEPAGTGTQFRHLPQPGSRQRGAGRPVEFGGMGRLDGALGPLSAGGGIPLRRDRGPRSLATRRDAATLAASKL